MISYSLTLAATSAATTTSYWNANTIGIWIAAILTLAIYSFLYKDNPIYKAAEHLFVGLSAGFILTRTFINILYPKLIQPLKTLINNPAHASIIKAPEGTTQFFVNVPGFRLILEYLYYLIPMALGIIMLMRLVPKIGWISRWALAFIVGVTAGLSITALFQANGFKQVKATMLPLLVTERGHINWIASINNWILVIGVVCCLIYFFFSKEHKGLIFGGASRLGIFFLMISFGASFGYTIMARVSLLIGRMTFLINIWLKPFFQMLTS